MGLESKTLLVLEHLRSSLDATTKEGLDSGIQKMRDEEQEKVAEIKELIGGSNAYEKFWSFHQNYFEANKVQLRDLASEEKKLLQPSINLPAQDVTPGKEEEVYSVEE